MTEVNQLLHERDQLTNQITPRIANPRRPDLSRVTYALWDAVGCINTRLHQLEAEERLGKVPDRDLTTCKPAAA